MAAGPEISDRTAPRRSTRPSVLLSAVLLPILLLISSCAPPRPGSSSDGFLAFLLAGGDEVIGSDIEVGDEAEEVCRGFGVADCASYRACIVNSTSGPGRCDIDLARTAGVSQAEIFQAKRCVRDGHLGEQCVVKRRESLEMCSALGADGQTCGAFASCQARTAGYLPVEANACHRELAGALPGLTADDLRSVEVLCWGLPEAETNQCVRNWRSALETCSGLGGSAEACGSYSVCVAQNRSGCDAQLARTLQGFDALNVYNARNCRFRRNPVDQCVAEQRCINTGNPRQDCRPGTTLCAQYL